MTILTKRVHVIDKAKGTRKTMRKTIVECDGCGIQVEFADDGSIVADESVTLEQRSMMSLRFMIGKEQFEICSAKCATPTVAKRLPNMSGGVALAPSLLAAPQGSLPA